jgi:hypothetical protein
MNISTTDKVKALLQRGKTQEEIFKALEISKNTFYARMKDHKWKILEQKAIAEM